MVGFSVAELRQSTVLYLYSTRDEIQIDPDYQRMGEIWTLEKRQLLIDSIINQFDVPKIYFHQLRKQSGIYKYAIIDGRQRLESIWSFIDGDYALADDIRYLNDSTVRLASLSYRELGNKYPRLKQLFDATSLSVMVVETEDRDLIEEMFSRLNEAVPLNAAEKRNALGGPIVKAIRKVAQSQFFTRHVSGSNKRYQYRDLAAKFLYLVHEEKVADTKKIYLDNFVKKYKTSSYAKIRPVMDRVEEVMRAMGRVFVKKDKLLKSAGMIVLYFLLFKEAMAEGWLKSITRVSLEEFETARANNRAKAEQDITRADYDLLEFDRLTQTPNDAYAITLRLKTLKRFVK